MVLQRGPQVDLIMHEVIQHYDCQHRDSGPESVRYSMRTTGIHETSSMILQGHV
jgi:hypothetical protein